jgi:hypothetical protein
VAHRFDAGSGFVVAGAVAGEVADVAAAGPGCVVLPERSTSEYVR